jgi:anti-sigma factor (TIGR02949 family)
MSDSMSCEDVLAKLYDYLDKEVDSGLEADIDEHIHSCRECFSRAEFERKLRKRVVTSVEVKPPDGVRSRLENLIKKF